MNEPLFVCCTRGSKEDTDLYRSLRKLGADRSVFFEHNRNGLPSCYNSVLDEKFGRDEVVVFVHDDVTIGDLFVREKLANAFEELGYGIAGLAGTSDFKITANLEVISWLQPPPEARSGAVEHQLAGMPAVMDVYGPTPKRCVVLDGLLLAVDLRKAGFLRFDEQFAFHFYDLDFCLAAHRAGLTLGTVNVYVTHKSDGGYLSDAFKQAQTVFRAKWKAGQYRVDAGALRGQHLAANGGTDLRSAWRDAPSDLSHRSSAHSSHPKPRRNELCYCGSGRRYKHCHGKLG